MPCALLATHGVAGAGSGSLAFIWEGSEAGGSDFTAQGAADQVGEANLFAPRFAGQNFLDLSGSRNVTGTLPLGSFVLGMIVMCIIVSYTLSSRNFLAL